MRRAVLNDKQKEMARGPKTAAAQSKPRNGKATGGGSNPTQGSNGFQLFWDFQMHVRELPQQSVLNLLRAHHNHVASTPGKGFTHHPRHLMCLLVTTTTMEPNLRQFKLIVISFILLFLPILRNGPPVAVIFVGNPS